MAADDSVAPLDAGARYAKRRLVPRYAIAATAEILEPIARARISAQISHISMSGCFIEMPEPWPINTVIQVRIRQDKEIFETWARVASIRSASGINGSVAEGAGMGVAFFQAEPDQEAILAGWIERLHSDEHAL